MLQRISIWAVIGLGALVVSCNSGQQESKNVPAEVKKPLSEVETLEKKLAGDSLNIEMRAVLAAKYYSDGQLQKAAFHFLKIYNQDNHNLIALTNLGNIYYDSRQDDQAIEFYEKAIAIDTANIDMRCDLATCYSNVNKSKMAINLLKENIKRNAKHQKSHYNLSVILRKTGDVKNADAEMKIYNSLAGAK